mmetsp:Transcript_9791/g.15020  ORF Transcript_9791/g.15020 Transcript_9791/m.15020 type:complete len:129 (-) Transcript_9791:398-784(-)
MAGRSLLLICDDPSRHKHTRSQNELKEKVMACCLPTILSFLDAKTLSITSPVCQYWSGLASEETLWNHLCFTQWGILPKYFSGNVPDAKRFFMLHQGAFEKMTLIDRLPGGFENFPLVPVSLLNQLHF